MSAPSLADCLALVRDWHRDRFDAWCRNAGAHSLGAALGLDPRDRPPVLETKPTAWDCFAGGRTTTTIAECITRKLTLAVAVYAGTDAGRAQPLVMLPVLASSTVLDASHRTPDLHVFILDGVARVLPIRRVRLNVPIRVGPDDRWVWGDTKPAPPVDGDAGAAYCQQRAAWDSADLGVTHRCLTVDGGVHMLVAAAAARHPDAATRTAMIRSAMATGNWPVGMGWTGVTHMARLNTQLALVAQLTTFSSPQQDAGPAVRQLGDGHVGVVDIFATSEGQNVGLSAALTLARLRHGASVGGDPVAAAAAVVSVAGGDGDVPAALVNGKVVLAARGDVGARPGEVDAVLALCGPGAHARWHGGALWVFTVPGLMLGGDGRWLGSASSLPAAALAAPDVIGCVSSAGPYVGFNQASRATFSYNMMQRAAGAGATPGAALRLRLKDFYVLECGQSPVVTTCGTGRGADDLGCGTGVSCSVVVMDTLASGGNPEDAIVVSQRFADLGGLSLRRETVLEASEDGLRGKFLGKAPDAPIAAPVDDDGLICAGTVVRPGDVVATFVDGSTVRVPTRWETVGQVESVAIFQQADNGDRTAVIRLAACGIGLLDGDKLVPRACSQKGTIRLVAAEDMPWCPVPEVSSFDLVFSASALPSRMTPGYILEMVNGLLGLADPAEHRPPAPLFGQPGVDPVPETANRAATQGVPLRVPVHDGATGVLQLGGGCGYGFVYTTTLFEHRARPKCYGKTRMASRVDAKTGQPLKGRAMGGSGRCGEMEKDALVMHGAMSVLQERFAAGGTGSTPGGDRAVRLLQAELAGCGIEMRLA